MKVSKDTAKRFISGDAKATEVVYNAYRKLLYFIIARYLRDKEDIDDAYQETFCRILQNRKNVEKAENLQGYLCQTAKNVAINLSIEKKEKATLSLDEEEIGKEEPKDFLSSLTPGLSRKESLILQARLVFDLSWSEVVELTGIPLSTAKLIYHQAIQKMRKGKYGL